MTTDIQNWRLYEDFSINYHSTKYNQIVYHWDNCPEDILYNCGYITNYNKHRLNRVQKHKDKIKNPYRDYGVDAISYDEKSDIYHILQMKCYNSPSQLKSSDLGSFAFTYYDRIKYKNPFSKGYVYFTCELERNLSIGVENNTNNPIIYENLPFNNTENNSITSDIKIKNEYKLWTHQQNAIDFIINKQDEKLLLLNIVCGGGKTLILSHSLQKTQPKILIIIAPLINLVNQLLERTNPFLDNYKSILIDSDSKGTTDIKIINKFLKTNKDDNIVIYSTYNSFINIIINFELLKNVKKTLVIDESHNIVNKNKVINYIENEENLKTILLTATPPSYLYEILNIDEKNVFTYSIHQAIEDNVICDYNVYIPFITNIDNDIKLIGTYDDTFVKKSVFLINGILKTGSRKCITYLNNIDECKMFKQLLEEICEYHGLSSYIEILTCDIKNEERKKILNIFENSGEYGIYILNSVRILDEGIDIVKCDSEFISKLTNGRSEIRTIQRLMRGSRKDKNNINKTNNLFLWNSENEDINNVLNMIKQYDYKLSTKIKTVSLNYGEQEDKKVKEEIEIKKEEFIKYIDKINIRKICTPEEKGELLLKYVEENKEIPKKKYENKNKIPLGSFWHHIKHNKSNKELYISKLSKNKILKEDYDRTQNIKNEKIHTYQYTPEEKGDLLLKYAEENKKIPKQNYVDKKKIQLGLFWSQIKQGHNKQIYIDKLSKNKILKEDYERIQSKKNENTHLYTPEEKGDLLLKYVEENKKIPKRTHKDENKVLLGRFWDGIKQGYNKQIYIDKLSKNKILKEDYEKSQTKKNEKKTKPQCTSEEKADILIKYIEENKNIPKRLYVDKNGVNIGVFWCNVKQGYHKQIYKNKLSKNKILRDNYEKVQIKRKI